MRGLSRCARPPAAEPLSLTPLQGTDPTAGPICTDDYDHASESINQKANRCHQKESLFLIAADRKLTCGLQSQWPLLVIPPLVANRTGSSETNVNICVVQNLKCVE